MLVHRRQCHHWEFYDGGRAGEVERNSRKGQRQRSAVPAQRGTTDADSQFGG